MEYRETHSTPEESGDGVSREARVLRARAALFASLRFYSLVIFFSNPPRVVLPAFHRVRHVYRSHITYFSVVVFRKENHCIFLRMERKRTMFTNS
jgi:hypothetical protein